MEKIVHFYSHFAPTTTRKTCNLRIVMNMYLYKITSTPPNKFVC